MPDEAFLRDRQQQIALSQLKKRLQQEQLAFDSGDSQYDDYQAQLDTAQSKIESLNNIRPSPPIRPVQS